MNTRIRRVRTHAASSLTVGEAQLLLQSIATDEREQKKLVERIATKEKKLFDLMSASKLVTVNVEGAEAAIVRSAGKAQNIIDPKGFMKKLPPEDYLQCLSVSVTRAKEFLPAKVLASITTTIPGTTGEPKLKVTVK